MRIPRRISEWAYTFVGGMIGGGAGAVLISLGLVGANSMGVTDIPKINLHTVGVIFLSGVVSHAMMFLAKSPLPPMSTGDTQQLTKPDSSGQSVKTPVT
ncbi:hypothetical protein KGP36_02870 [Patescibacteria group bacterium]|nr:hypothetical protein [Patescibacteria group bacterium]